MTQPMHIRITPLDPATLATIIRSRIATGEEATVTQRAYVAHYDACPQCRAAADVAGLCSAGKHLYHKLTSGEDAQPQARRIPPCGACGCQSEDLTITGCACDCHALFAGILESESER